MAKVRAAFDKWRLRYPSVRLEPVPEDVIEDIDDDDDFIEVRIPAAAAKAIAGREPRSSAEQVLAFEVLRRENVISFAPVCTDRLSEAVGLEVAELLRARDLEADPDDDSDIEELDF